MTKRWSTFEELMKELTPQTDYGRSQEFNEFENNRVSRAIDRLKTPCNYEKWAKFDAWEIKQAVCIVGGLDPDNVLGMSGYYWFKKDQKLLRDGDREIFEECVHICGRLEKIFNNLRGSYLAGKLPIIGKWDDGDTLIGPPVVASWALSKGYPVHSDIEQLETPELMAERLNQTDLHPWETICAIESRWPKMPKYKVAAVVKGLDPDDEDTRKQAENFYQKTKKGYLETEEGIIGKV